MDEILIDKEIAGLSNLPRVAPPKKKFGTRVFTAPAN